MDTPRTVLCKFRNDSARGSVTNTKANAEANEEDICVERHTAMDSV